MVRTSPTPSWIGGASSSARSRRSPEPPGEQPDHAARAVACALALDEYVQAFRARCHKKGIALGVRRIGVHAGPAIVGNFGGGRFFDYTAYGDTINVAARLEAANKQLGTRICAIARLHRFCVCAERLGRRRELDAKFPLTAARRWQSEGFPGLPFACVRAAIYVQDFTCRECGVS